MKYWNQLENKREVIVDMAINLSDLNIFSDETLRRMYNEMNGISGDIYEYEITHDIIMWVEQEEEPKLSLQQLTDMVNYCLKNNDSNLLLWDNIEKAYNTIIKG